MADVTNRKKTKTTVAGLVIAILIGGYTVFRPAINQATGWNLPAISQDETKVADRLSPSESEPAPPPTAEEADRRTEDSSPRSDPSLKYGLLQEIGPDRYLSPAGLLYTPGSAEGHRLEHLKRHTADQPGRPGKHGVFDGGIEGALTTIEKAYEKAKVKQRTTTQVDGSRTIYTVDMGKRIGYVGGREGNQKSKPMARRIRLVLEGNRVITAFPL